MLVPLGGQGGGRLGLQRHAPQPRARPGRTRSATGPEGGPRWRPGTVPSFADCPTFRPTKLGLSPSRAEGGRRKAAGAGCPRAPGPQIPRLLFSTRPTASTPGMVSMQRADPLAQGRPRCPRGIGRPFHRDPLVQPADGVGGDQAQLGPGPADRPAPACSRGRPAPPAAGPAGCRASGPPSGRAAAYRGRAGRPGPSSGCPGPKGPPRPPRRGPRRW